MLWFLKHSIFIEKSSKNSGIAACEYYIISGANVLEKNERTSAGSNELADYLTTKRIEFSYSTGKLGKKYGIYAAIASHVTTNLVLGVWVIVFERWEFW